MTKSKCDSGQISISRISIEHMPQGPHSIYMKGGWREGGYSLHFFLTQEDLIPLVNKNNIYFPNHKMEELRKN